MRETFPMKNGRKRARRDICNSYNSETHRLRVLVILLLLLFVVIVVIIGSYRAPTPTAYIYCLGDSVRPI